MPGLFRTSNPALGQNTFKAVESAAGGQKMTIDGATNKTFFFSVLLLCTALWTWREFYKGDIQTVMACLWAGIIGGLVFALLTIFIKKIAAITGSLYALCEGLVLGGISAIFEKQYPGIVIQAVSLTLGVLLMLLFAYKSRIIKVTEKFKLGVFAATAGIALVYLIDLILGFFNIGIPYIHQSGWIGIGFSVFVVIIASLNLVLDFDFIESGAEAGAPKYMEWYAAFGIIVTLVWLYIEILNLLAKLRSRR